MAKSAHSTIAPFGVTAPSPFSQDSGDSRSSPLASAIDPVPLEAAPMSGRSISRRTMIAALSALPLAGALATQAKAESTPAPDSPWTRMNDHSQELLAAVEDLAEASGGRWRCVVSPDGPYTVEFQNLHAKRVQSQRRLDNLIARHQAASDTYLHWADLRDEIEDSGRIPPVQVWYGRLLEGRDENDEQRFSPLYATSKHQLRSLADQHYYMSTQVFHQAVEKAEARRRDWFADKCAEFDRARWRHNGARRRTGLVKVEREIDKALNELDAASIALLTHRPADYAETNAKRDYMRSAGLTADCIGGDHTLISAMLDWFCCPTTPSALGPVDRGRYMRLDYTGGAGE